jgi:hypothetical protein
MSATLTVEKANAPEARNRAAFATSASEGYGIDKLTLNTVDRAYLLGRHNVPLGLIAQLYLQCRAHGLVRRAQMSCLSQRAPDKGR